MDLLGFEDGFHARGCGNDGGGAGGKGGVEVEGRVGVVGFGGGVCHFDRWLLVENLYEESEQD